MTRAIVAATPLTGHTVPLLQIAEHLLDAGHEVTFVGGERFCARAQALGAAVRPLTGVAGYDDRRLAEAFPARAAAAAGVEQLSFDIAHVFGDVVPDQHAALQEVLADDPDQVLVTDITFLGAWPSALGAGRRPRRWVSVGMTPLYVPSDDTTPFGPVPVGPDGDPAAGNRAALAALEEGLADGVAHVREVLGGLGVQRQVGAWLETGYGLQDITAQLTVPEFEFPRSDLPASVRFTGPLPPTPGPWTEPVWWGDLDGGRPVVVVTQGTLANGDLGEVVIPTLEALADDDVLVVAALGRDVASLAGPVPDNARVTEFIPFDVLFERSDVLVTNGGYGATQLALAAGMPVVVAGVREDKPAVAARVAYHGVGIDLATGNPSAGQVREAVQTVLTEERYRTNAQKISKAYAQHDGPREIVELVTAEPWER